MTHCPCCGQGVDSDGLLFSLDTNRVSRLGCEVRLQPMEAEVLDVLLRRHPQRTSLGMLRQAIYGAQEGPPTNLSLRTTVSHLRSFLGALGVFLETYRDLGRRFDDSGGYCLWIDHASQQASWPPLPRRKNGIVVRDQAFATWQEARTQKARTQPGNGRA